MGKGRKKGIYSVEDLLIQVLVNLVMLIITSLIYGTVMMNYGIDHVTGNIYFHTQLFILGLFGILFLVVNIFLYKYLKVKNIFE